MPERDYSVTIIPGNKFTGSCTQAAGSLFHAAVTISVTNFPHVFVTIKGKKLGSLDFQGSRVWD